MKQKKQLAVLVVLLLILVVVGYFYFDSDKPVVTTDAGSAAQNPQILVDNPQLHTAGVEKARNTEYKSGGRIIFSREIPAPQPTKKEIDAANKKHQDDLLRVAEQVKNSPPQVSKLPVKFFGYGTIPNGTARVAFFNDGDDVYIVKEGELLMNRFRILRIGNTNLDYEEISSGLRGTAILEEQAGPPSA
jgi:hypothetical protein